MIPNERHHAHAFSVQNRELVERTFDRAALFHRKHGVYGASVDVEIGRGADGAVPLRFTERFELLAQRKRGVEPTVTRRNKRRETLQHTVARTQIFPRNLKNALVREGVAV